MSKTFKIVIEYDGTKFHGWQRQDAHRTIQGELEAVLSKILNQPVSIHGSGRTDAGVHARGQVAHFSAETQIPPKALQRGVNSIIHLPIVILSCEVVPDDFHAQYQVVSKTYRYYILNRSEPRAVGRDYCWHVSHPLDMDAMNRCAKLLLGIHDFKAFENTGSPRSSTVREIFEAEWTRQGEMLVFTVSASGFLKNMVRNLVGTLKDAGIGKISCDRFGQILESCDRSRAGATAPAKGLFLHKVTY